MRELVLGGVLVLGLVVGIVGHFWMIVRAFQTTWWWGLLAFLFPPAQVAFALTHFRRARAPLSVIALGLIIGGGAYAANALSEKFVGFGPREKHVEAEVDGTTRRELHVTLTGWDQADYSVLRHRPDVVVLQMANPDVTDGSLAVLKELTQVRELDLNDTQTTDEGLRIVAELPKLEQLRLRGTKITDAGFREFLLPKAGLKMLDVRQTEVTKETVAEWKKAQPGRRSMR